MPIPSIGPAPVQGVLRPPLLWARRMAVAQIPPTPGVPRCLLTPTRPIVSWNTGRGARPTRTPHFVFAGPVVASGAL